MKMEADFYRFASQIEKPRMQDIQNNKLPQRVAVIYVDTICELVAALKIENFECSKIEGDYNDSDLVADKFFYVLRFVQTLYARNILEIDGTLKSVIINLDDTWKNRVSVYLRLIREIVRDAKIKDNHRQSISNRLENLQREVERNQTRLESVIQMGVEICKGIAQGSKELKPAVELYNRLSGGLGGLQSVQENEKSVPQLTAPEALGLPAPDAELSEPDTGLSEKEQ